MKRRHIKNDGIPPDSGQTRINRADNPIKKPEEDTLGRAKSARSFAKQILSLDVSQGIVVGVLGPWGSGKTSFVNLAKVYLKNDGIPIIDFNPWMFSGAEQLVQAFFAELSAQLKVHTELSSVGESIEEYGEIFSGLGSLPLVGPWIESARVASKILAAILKHRKEGIGERRIKVEKALTTLDKPIVVVLDDIDRLGTSEIRDIFRLVRLTANFPNIIYILAFDRARVEKALAEEGIPGRDYLEKILQVGFDLPVVPEIVLRSQILQAIDAALSSIDNKGPFDEDIWPDVFMEIIRPLFRNMRDVRRYVAAIYGTVRDLEGNVALVDVLAIEAIRVFLPDVYCKMHIFIDGLTTTSDSTYAGLRDPPHLKKQIDKLIESAGDHADVVRALIQQLFPAAQRHIGGVHFGGDWKSKWLRERRIAHEDIFHFYLERIAGEGFQAFIDAEKAWFLLADAESLSNFLRSLDAERLQDVVGALENYEDKFSPEHVVPGTVVLLNLVPILPERQRGMFDLDAETVVRRVVYRLIRSLKKPEVIEKIVEEILPRVTTLSSKLSLITIIGYREGAGHELVSRAAATKFEKSWRSEVYHASGDTLAEETDILRILLIMKRDSDPADPAIEVPDSPRMTLALFRSAHGETRSQTITSRHVRRSARLAWDALIEIFGSEQALREQIDKLRVAKIEGSEEVLLLADKYLEGWRPDNLNK